MFINAPLISITTTVIFLVNGFSMLVNTFNFIYLTNKNIVQEGTFGIKKNLLYFEVFFSCKPIKSRKLQLLKCLYCLFLVQLRHLAVQNIVKVNQKIGNNLYQTKTESQDIPINSFFLAALRKSH